MLISVVIPAYNRSADIKNAVSSALHQEHQDIEILVVDDCSKDNTAAVVDSIHSPKVKLLRRKKNGGASAARNTGIDAAQGEIIAFLDSDDLWFPTKLSRNLAFMRENGLGSDSKWVAYNRVEIRTDFGRQTSLRTPPIRPSMAELLFCGVGFIQTSAVFLPTALAKQTLFAENVSWVDDWEFLLRLDRAGAPSHFHDEVLTIHNAFAGATRMSNRGNAEHLIRWIESYRNSLSPKELAGFYATRVAPQLILSGERLKAMKMLASGVVNGGLPPRTAAIEALRAFAPPRVFSGLRAVLGRGRA